MVENNHEPIMWEKFIQTIYGEIGDGLSLFSPHFTVKLNHMYIYIYRERERYTYDNHG